MAMAASDSSRADQKPRSLFDLPPDFFDHCRLLHPHQSEAFLPSIPSPSPLPPPSSPASDREKGEEERGTEAGTRWTCGTCDSEFDSLQDQRSHFKSDVHRLNVKLRVAGKNTVKEEDVHELSSTSLFEDFDVSSISGSEDESENVPRNTKEGVKQKLYLHLHSGDTVSIWRSVILDESEDILIENNSPNHVGNGGCFSLLEEGELIDRLKLLVREPRDKTHLRIMFLASGGHFAGCVFDGNSIVAHKTFHRYVVRAKAGKKQSAKDGTGKAANSAGSSLRRYNEAALKKEIQELFVAWKPYIDSSSSIFIHAPSKNRQVFFDGDKSQFSFPEHAIRHVPLTVHRPTLKEAKRIYNHLTHMAYEVAGKVNAKDGSSLSMSNEGKSSQQTEEAQVGSKLKEDSSESGSVVDFLPLVENISILPCENETTPLHEAAKSGDAQRTLVLLEQGLNPCVKDSRGRTPYMLAIDKEVRNTFRRYMASNIDKWDWHAASVPSALTKEMEDSHAAKQAEKDAKRKAKAKELKKLRKAKEKAKAQAAQAQNASTVAPQGQTTMHVSTSKQQPLPHRAPIISKEEEQRRALAAEREKRAAAAERRMAAATAACPADTAAPSSLEPKSSGANDVLCSCCNASLAGKIPFHRYHYKYCSTSCMHVHREMLEEGDVD